MDYSSLTPEEKRARHKQQQKEWYERNKQRVREKQKQYYYDNDGNCVYKRYKDFYDKFYDKVMEMGITP